MASMDVLRERGRWTRAALLSLIVQQPGLSRTRAARQLGLTVQAISIQAQDLLDDGLVRDDGGLFILPSGVQRLTDEVEALSGAARQLREPLTTLQLVRAIADARIPEGLEVALFMRDGDLHAAPGSDSPSRGVAANDARPGDEVLVRGPTGIVDLAPGTVHVMRVPEAAHGGVGRVDARMLKPWRGLVAALGTGASILAGRVDRFHIRFAAAEVAINAAQRGIDVRLYVDGEQVADALRIIEAANRGPDRVDVTLRDAPLKAP